MSWRSLLLILLAVALGAFVVLQSDNPAPGLALIAGAAGFILWLWSPSGTVWRDVILTDTTGEPATSERGNGAWFLAGFVILVMALALLEWEQPYYFTQDDALVCELPSMLVG